MGYEAEREMRVGQDVQCRNGLVFTVSIPKVVVNM